MHLALFGTEVLSAGILNCTRGCLTVYKAIRLYGNKMGDNKCFVQELGASFQFMFPDLDTFKRNISRRMPLTGWPRYRNRCYI